MIPAMTDELGRYWRQPADIRDAPIDGSHVLLTRRQFDGLSDYTASLPSGVYPGKCWRRRTAVGWVLVWFGVDPKNKAVCTIESRFIRIGRLKGAADCGHLAAVEAAE